MKNYQKLLWLSILVIVSYSCSKNDKILGAWLQPIPGMEHEMQGITLGGDGKASSINMHTLVYEHWNMLDSKRMVLSGKSIGNGQTLEFSDTLDIIKLDSDSLILQEKGLCIRYFRQKMK